MKDIELADRINPGGIATWNGDLSSFKDRGGKIITFHGRRDSVSFSHYLLHPVRLRYLSDSTIWYFSAIVRPYIGYTFFQIEFR